jgi:hypothetical protein
MFEKIRAGKLGLDTCFELGKFGFTLNEFERGWIMNTALESLILGYNKYEHSLRYIRAQLSDPSDPSKIECNIAAKYLDVYKFYQQNGYVKNVHLRNAFETLLILWKPFIK